MTIERLLFAVHRTHKSGRPVAATMAGHCLPLACSHHSWGENPGGIPATEDGFYALWESCGDVEEFFSALELNVIECGPGETHPEGLYVYEVKYAPEDVVDDFNHLQGGKLRRPRINELEAFTESGAAPWGGVVL